ncbi:MAG: hypothetical protein M9894_36305 [Planctomycetes bacterium]|nr:hypothetical protein [Planctomycetota bacterium]
MARRPRDPVEPPDDGESSADALGSDSDEDALADALTSDSGAVVDDADDDDRRPDPVKFPFGESHDPTRRPARDRVKFPFGSSGDAPFGSTSSGRGLPNLPPDARPEDDASLEGLSDEEGLLASSDEDLVDLSDLGKVSARVSDLGPISPSGPLVILDDEEPGASTRFQASIVDDSARLAGSAGDRRGRRPRRPRRADEAADDDVDADVPTPDRSTRAPRPSARAAAPAPAAGGGRAMALRIALALVAVGAALLLGEVRRQKDLEAERARHAREVAALRQAHGEALEGERRRAGDAVEGERARAEQDRRLALERAAADAAAERARAAEEARREGERAAREAAEREAREAIAVELARARAAGDDAADDAARRAREEERARGEAALAEQAAREAARRREALEALRAELEDELFAMTTRAEEEAMARLLAEERAAALDRAQPKGGGSAAEAVDDWDKYFSGGGSGGSSAAGGAGDGGGAGDDPFAARPGGHPVDQAWAWLKENLHGSVGYRNLSHFSRGDHRKTRHEMRVKLDYRGWLWRTDDASKGLRLVSILDLRVDDADYAVGLPRGLDDEERRRPILWPEELHLDLAWDFLTLKAGYQVFAWGTGDLLNPTDILNPIDFSDLFDTRRISVMAVSVEATFERVSLELVSIPSFTRARLPLAGKRFDVLSGASPVPILRPDDPDSSLQNAQWGARVKGNALGWDVSLSGFTGYDPLPSPRLAIRSLAPLDVVIDPRFDRRHMVGADFATTLGFLGLGGRLGDILGGIQLHGEVAHFFIEGQRQDDFGQVVVGLNYTWIDLIAEHDLTLVLEYAGDFTTSRAEQALPGVRLNRVLRGAVLARLEYAVDQDLSFEVNAAVITHGRENALIHPGVRWNVTDNLRLELGGDIFLGPDDTFFGQFRRDGRVIFDVRWVF